MIEEKVLRILPEWLYKAINHEYAGIEEFVQFCAHQLKKGDLVLDAGAGECPYKRFFAHTRYIAVDFARGDATWDYSQLDIIADLEKLPFKENLFDAILSTQVLEHSRNPLNLLKELRWVMKKGAKLFLTAPFGFGIHQAPYDYFRFTEFGLRTLLEQAGFKVEYLAPRGGYLKYISLMLTYIYFYIFYAAQPFWLKILLLPLRLLFFIGFLVFIPLIFGILDRVLHFPQTTTGYKAIAVK